MNAVGNQTELLLDENSLADFKPIILNERTYHGLLTSDKSDPEAWTREHYRKSSLVPTSLIPSPQTQRQRATGVAEAHGAEADERVHDCTFDP